MVVGPLARQRRATAKQCQAFTIIFYFCTCVVGK